MLGEQQLIELSNLIKDKDPILADKLLKLNSTFNLGIVTEQEANNFIDLAKDLVRGILFPQSEIEATPKVIVPITTQDLVAFQNELKLVIKHNSVTNKYDVFNLKGEHKLEFELTADKEEIENQLKVLQ